MIDVQAIIKDALANQQDPYTELAKQLFNTQQPNAKQRRKPRLAIGTTSILEELCKASTVRSWL